MNTQDWPLLGWTSWISLQSKGLSRVFSNTTVQKHQFFSAHLSSQSNSHIHPWPLEKPQPWLERPLWIQKIPMVSPIASNTKGSVTGEVEKVGDSHPYQLHAVKDILTSANCARHSHMNTLPEDHTHTHTNAHTDTQTLGLGRVLCKWRALKIEFQWLHGKSVVRHGKPVYCRFY